MLPDLQDSMKKTKRLLISMTARQKRNDRKLLWGKTTHRTLCRDCWTTVLA